MDKRNEIIDWLNNREKIIKHLMWLGASLYDSRRIFYIINEINLMEKNIIKKHCE